MGHTDNGQTCPDLNSFLELSHKLSQDYEAKSCLLPMHEKTPQVASTRARTSSTRADAVVIVRESRNGYDEHCDAIH